MPTAPLLTSAAVKSFPPPKFGTFEFQGYYAGDKKYWQAVTPFELNIELDKNLDADELQSIEYRQYISGGCWFTVNDRDWEAEPNANSRFKVPTYEGQSTCVELPMQRVGGTGLVMGKWKEDGEKVGGEVQRYGYRATATMDTPGEADLWHNLGGTKYLLRDTPSIRGRWFPDMKESKLPLWVWMEIWFLGAVVQTRPEGNTTVPIKVLQKRQWKVEWINATLPLFSAAKPIDKPADHDNSI